MARPRGRSLAQGDGRPVTGGPLPGPSANGAQATIIYADPLDLGVYLRAADRHSGDRNRRDRRRFPAAARASRRPRGRAPSRPRGTPGAAPGGARPGAPVRRRSRPGRAGRDTSRRHRRQAGRGPAGTRRLTQNGPHLPQAGGGLRPARTPAPVSDLRRRTISGLYRNSPPASGRTDTVSTGPRIDVLFNLRPPVLARRP